MTNQNKIYHKSLVKVLIWLSLITTILYACEKIEPERVAKVTTASVSDIEYTTSTAEGVLVDVPDEGVTQHGHCWSNTENPDINSPRSMLGNRKTKGSFQSVLGELTPGTRYYVRAYAQAGDDVSYGENLTFSTYAASLPSVSTYSASSITMSSASCGGEVTSDGGYPVESRGICWNTTGNPTPEQNAIPSGTGLGSFESQMTGLTPRTTYFVRAYAVSQVGTQLGNEISFSTSDMPSVQTIEITGISPSSVTIVGDVTDEGNAVVSERGFCWDFSPNPTIDGPHASFGSGSGEYTGTLEELSSAIQIFIRAYATNVNGTVYGNNIPVVTPFSDERDGQTYPVVLIGDQYWMAANLNHGTYLHSSENQTDNSIIEKFCYDNNEANCELFGGYYAWYEMMQYVSTESVQGVCPSGWHIPSDSEWKTLEMTLGMSQTQADAENWRGTDEGGKLKLEGTDIWQFPNQGATNESGFSALPGGYYDVLTNNDFIEEYVSATFWTSTEVPTTFTSYYRTVEYTVEQVFRSPGYQGNSAPVRCVKD